MLIRPPKCFILTSPCGGGGGWDSFSVNLTERALIFSSVARYFSVQTPNPSATSVSTSATYGKLVNDSGRKSSATYDKRINDAGRQGDFATVRQLLVKRMSVGLFNTQNTFKFLSADISKLPELLENLATIDVWFVRKQAHDALVAKLAWMRRMPDALRVVETMVKKNYGATPVTFRPLFVVLTRKRDIEAAWHVMEVMRVCNVKPELMSFNHILTAYCCLGDLASAADVLVKLEEEGLDPDRMTYEALVIGACKARKLVVAIKVMRRMLEVEMSPLECTHTHIIKELVKCGYIAQATEYVNIFSGRDKKLDAENFGYLAKCLMNSKRIAEATSVLVEMKKRELSIRDEWKSKKLNAS